MIEVQQGEVGKWLGSLEELEAENARLKTQVAAMLKERIEEWERKLDQFLEETDV